MLAVPGKMLNLVGREFVLGSANTQIHVRENVMNAWVYWALLFAGNAVLLWLWVNYVVKVLIGRCPHCGK